MFECAFPAWGDLVSITCFRFDHVPDLRRQLDAEQETRRCLSEQVLKLYVAQCQDAPRVTRQTYRRWSVTVQRKLKPDPAAVPSLGLISGPKC